MASKPTPGGSSGSWGIELNAFLDVSLDSGGFIKDGATLTTSAAPTVPAGVANKKYVDDNSGAANYTPTSQTGDNDSPGTIVFPNGFMMAWGQTGWVTANGNLVVDHGLTTKCFKVFLQATGSDASDRDAAGTTHIGDTSFRINNASNKNEIYDWFAIGR